MSSTDQPSKSTTSNPSTHTQSPPKPPNTVEETKISSTPRLDLQLAPLFSETVLSKIFHVAIRLLNEQGGLITRYPETVPQTGPTAGIYETRDKDFWTAGFFPGSLYLLLERCVEFPQCVNLPPSHLEGGNGWKRESFTKELSELAWKWKEGLKGTEKRVDTHDLGFMLLPAFRADWELTGDRGSLGVLVRGAGSLSARYDERVKAIRSWDQQITKRYSYTDKDADFLVIIDSMCNLDLLFYAGHHTGNQEIIDIATMHAKTVLKHVVRDDGSTCHLVVFDTQTGDVKKKLTCQGYSDESTWSRGQAWAILGFTQTYTWTHDPVFLSASLTLASYFLSRLDTSPHPYPYIPPWDFDEPVSEEGPLRDTSAGMIAANGMLLLSQVLRGSGRDDEGKRMFDAAVRTVRETVELSFDRLEEKVHFSGHEMGETEREKTGEGERNERFDAILRNATANANQDALRRYADHGLVYADYYFLEFGNKLLRMGLI